ncbi:MAG: dihydropteroate synthase [Bacteroidales bacterium]|nr:dihydropteroate synthase [Bacteroidales bacterium]
MLGKSTAFSENRILTCRGKILDLNAPKIMGIINLSANSFFDGGQNIKNDFFLIKAEELIKGGASILDIGAASTKPGSKIISIDEEWKILERPLRLLKEKYPELLFSIDTYHAATAQKAADLGVEIINDISGGTIDSKMFEVVAKNQMAYVLMHIKGRPENMQQNPVNGDVVASIQGFFENQLAHLEKAGVQTILLDPGFGFGKTLDQNYQLLNNLSQFKQFDRPLLVGLSRKSMIFKLLDINPQEALNGTAVLNTIALLNGANILRVHDAQQAHETIQLIMKYKQF